MTAMERCGTGRLVIVISLYLVMSYDSVVTTSGIDDHHDYSDDVINAARCRVRCLSLFQVGLFVAFVVAVCEKHFSLVTVIMTNSPKYVLPTSKTKKDAFCSISYISINSTLVTGAFNDKSIVLMREQI